MDSYRLNLTRTSFNKVHRQTNTRIRLHLHIPMYDFLPQWLPSKALALLWLEEGNGKDASHPGIWLTFISTAQRTTPTSTYACVPCQNSSLKVSHSSIEWDKLIGLMFTELLAKCTDVQSLTVAELHADVNLQGCCACSWTTIGVTHC